MSRIQQKATEIGLAISERFSDATLNFLEEWDPDLHYAVMEARKNKGIKDCNYAVVKARKRRTKK